MQVAPFATLLSGAAMSATTMGIKLDEKTRERLKKLGRTRDRSPHWLMKQAIAQYLDIEERNELERLEDEERYQRYLDSDEHISDVDMVDWLEQLAKNAAAKAGD